MLAWAQSADRIVAVVNNDPITASDVELRVKRVTEQARGGSLPPAPQLRAVVLERLIGERAQLQAAEQLGIKVSEADVDAAVLDVAQRNGLDRDGLHKQLVGQGLDIGRFRDELRRELLLQRARERFGRVREDVTSAEIDAYLAEQGRRADPGLAVVNLAYLVVAIPESATPAEVDAARAEATRLADAARQGADFAELARKHSSAPNAANGGELGPRTLDRLPELFVKAIEGQPAGSVLGPLRSPAGFHVLKLLDRRSAGMPNAVVQQTHARHILIRPDSPRDEPTVLARLNLLRSDIMSGKTRFEDAARSASQDSSAAQGGDLGWAVPGQFVPEFEQAMNRLAPGAVSEPVVSRFGVHLIQVLERRQVALSEAQQREQVRALLREQKSAEAYADWAREARARAYVDIRADDAR